MYDYQCGDINSEKVGNVCVPLIVLYIIPSLDLVSIPNWIDTLIDRALSLEYMVYVEVEMSEREGRSWIRLPQLDLY